MRLIVPDRVVREIIDQLLHLLPVGAENRLAACEGDADAVLVRLDLQLLHAVLRNGIEIERLRLLLGAGAEIQLREADNIVDELEETLRVLMNFLSEPDCILLRGNPGFNQLRVSGDRRERRLELMRDIRGEFLALRRRHDDILLLALDGIQQRLQLLIGIRRPDCQRLLRHIPDRLQELDREIPRYQHGERDHHCGDHGDIGQHPDENIPDSADRIGAAEHRPVGEPLRVVARHAARHGLRGSCVLARPVLKRLLDLRPVQMIHHRSRLRLIVEEDGTVCRDPGDTRGILRLHPRGDVGLQIGHRVRTFSVVIAGDQTDGRFHLVHRLRLHFLPEDERCEQQCERNRQHRHCHQIPVQFLLHPAASPPL